MYRCMSFVGVREAQYAFKSSRPSVVAIAIILFLVRVIEVIKEIYTVYNTVETNLQTFYINVIDNVTNTRVLYVHNNVTNKSYENIHYIEGCNY